MVLLPGKSHGQRSLLGYSAQGHRVRHKTTKWESLLESKQSASDAVLACLCPQAARTPGVRSQSQVREKRHSIPWPSCSSAPVSPVLGPQVLPGFWEGWKCRVLNKRTGEPEFTAPFVVNNPLHQFFSKGPEFSLAWFKHKMNGQ